MRSIFRPPVIPRFRTACVREEQWFAELVEAELPDDLLHVRPGDEGDEGAGPRGVDVVVLVRVDNDHVVDVQQTGVVLVDHHLVKVLLLGQKRGAVAKRIPVRLVGHL